MPPKKITTHSGEIRPKPRKKPSHRARRIVAAIILCGGIAAWLILNPKSYQPVDLSADENAANTSVSDPNAPLATEILEKLEVKGRAPKTGYTRTQFYNDWPTVDGCNLRQRILKRDFGDTAVLDGCTVIAGEYDEPYTGEHQVFTEKSAISKQVQIDHVVALSDAWQTGAQYQSAESRYALATDPLNLLAVDSAANSQKSDGDAATWLPANKSFRCEYVARQLSVKYKYSLWLTSAEHDAIAKVLESCPNQSTLGI